MAMGSPTPTSSPRSAPRGAVHRRLGRTSGSAPEDARRANRSLVLQALHHGGPASRAELAKVLHVTPATVSTIVRDLLDEEIVEELGRSTVRNVGKPATMIDIRGDGRLIAVVDCSPQHHFVSALVDLSGRVVHRHDWPRDDRTGDEALVLLRTIVADLVERAERPLLGVGVASPGYVDEAGVVADAAHLGWKRVDLPLELPTGAVHAFNDANAAALSELTFGPCDGQDLIVVRVDEGIGAGLVLDGRLHSGPNGGGGEIGHVVVDPDGQLCACGAMGCLETVVRASLLREQLAESGDRDDALAAAGTALGRAISMLVSALDVSDIVVSGSEEITDDSFREGVLAGLTERVSHDLAGQLAVRHTAAPSSDVLLGAAALVLDRELDLR